MTPDKSHADEMLSAAEKAASEKYDCACSGSLCTDERRYCEGDRRPFRRYLHSICQAEVGGRHWGNLSAILTRWTLVCNDEGKLVNPENYELVYTVALTEHENLENIYDML